MPKVYNVHNCDAPSDAVYIGRGSLYGNPFHLGKDGTRTEVIKRFCDEILPNLDVSALEGKDLVCFCKPKSCLGDAILLKANSSNLNMFF